MLLLEGIYQKRSQYIVLMGSRDNELGNVSNELLHLTGNSGAESSPILLSSQEDAAEQRVSKIN